MGDLSARPHLLALPGLLGDDLMWRAQADALADVADVTIADLSGGDDLTEMARCALGAVEGPVHVAGHSMGGRVALEAWRVAPGRIRSLVLLDTGVHGVRPEEVAGRRELVALSAEQGMDALADAWLPPMVHPDRRTDAVLMGMLRDMVGRATPDQHERQIRALLTRPDATDLLATIDVPTLVIVGAADEWSPVDQHRAIAAAIPGARLAIIEDAGHMVTLERPEAVTALLREWLTTPASGRPRPPS